MKVILSDVISFYHLLSGVSYGFYKKEAMREVKIILLKNSREEYLLPEGKIHINGCALEIKYSKKESSWAMKFIIFMLARAVRLVWCGSQVDAVFLGHHTYFKPSTLQLLTLKEIWSLHTFAFEEGVGTYGGLKHHIRAAAREGRRFPILKYLFRRFLQAKIFLDERWGAIGGRHDSSEVITSHNKALELLDILYDNTFPRMGLNLSNTDDSIKRAIFFTTPLVEIGVLSQYEYMQVLTKIKNRLNSLGFTVYFKLHPTECVAAAKDYDNLLFLGSKLPAELLLYKVKPDLVAGFNSGALILAKYIFALNAIECLDILPVEAANKLRYSDDLELLFKRAVKSINVL